MATAMTATVDDVSFSCPVITPKSYLVKGPSGWPETFDRRTLDDELERFLHPVPPREMATLFVQMRAVADKQEPANWHTIVGYLGRTLGISPRTIPQTVGVAFWATIEIVKREQVAN